MRERWLNPPEWTETRTLEFPGIVTGPWSRFVVNPDKNGLGTVRYPRLEPRDADCAARLKERTLTKLYNERPTWLNLAHKRLDTAVAAATTAGHLRLKRLDAILEKLSFRPQPQTRRRRSQRQDNQKTEGPANEGSWRTPLIVDTRAFDPDNARRVGHVLAFAKPSVNTTISASRSPRTSPIPNSPAENPDLSIFIPKVDFSCRTWLCRFMATLVIVFCNPARCHY